MSQNTHMTALELTEAAGCIQRSSPKAASWGSRGATHATLSSPGSGSHAAHYGPGPSSRIIPSKTCTWVLGKMLRHFCPTLQTLRAVAAAWRGGSAAPSHAVPPLHSHCYGWRDSRTSRLGNRLPREAVESPSLEIFKTHLDTVLCSLLWVTLLWQGGWTGWPTEVPVNPCRAVILWDRARNNFFWWQCQLVQFFREQQRWPAVPWNTGWHGRRRTAPGLITESRDNLISRFLWYDNCSRSHHWSGRPTLPSLETRQ